MTSDINICFPPKDRKPLVKFCVKLEEQKKEVYIKKKINRTLNKPENV